MNYEILKARLNNGKPFLKKTALERIAKLLNNLEITETQADELNALAEQNGVEILPTDALGRLDAVESTTEELTLMMADMIGGTV